MKADDAAALRRGYASAIRCVATAAARHAFMAHVVSSAAVENARAVVSALGRPGAADGLREIMAVADELNESSDRLERMYQAQTAAWGRE